MAQLALASKILFDEIIVQQQQQIEELQQRNDVLLLEKFFHGGFSDIEKGSLANFEAGKLWTNVSVTKCACNDCITGRRADEEDILTGTFSNMNTDTCSWQPWFDDLLIQRGFVIVRRETFAEKKAPFFAPNMNHYDQQRFVDVDCHFRLHSSWRGYLQFGTKLHGARRRDDPEIVKYEALLEYFEDLELHYSG